MITDDLRKLRPRPSAPFRPAEIKVLEKKIGQKLPDDYRRMLGAFGGCSFESSTYYHDPKHHGPVMFGWFFGANELHDSLGSLTESIPDSMIPIGEDGGGNVYCLGIHGNDRDQVYFHDHNIGWQADAAKYIERGEPIPSRLRYQTVYLLAASFREFVQGMYIEE